MSLNRKQSRSVVHAAARGHGRRFLFFRQLRHHGVSGQDQTGNRGSVLQCQTRDLGRVQDARFQHVAVGAVGRVVTEGALAVFHFREDDSGVFTGIGDDLTQRFFDELQQRFAANLCLMLAEREGKIIAGTFNVRDDTAMYGRYWGAFEEHPFLHFNDCYYAAIEHSIRLGLARFEAGAGGSFKQLRGLDPQHTVSAHYFVNGDLRRAVERFLRQEREVIRRKREMMVGQR